MKTPRDAVDKLIFDDRLPKGDDERYTGFGPMGVPFGNGHYLAFRGVVTYSAGPGFRSVWHRDPEGRWTIYADAPADRSCPRYFGAAASGFERVPEIAVSWTDSWNLRVEIPGRLEWNIELKRSLATRLMTAMSRCMPSLAWNSTSTLGMMSPMAGAMLGVGKVRLAGRVPNGQRYKAAPLKIWRVAGGSAVLDGTDLGELGALAKQERLGDFWMPQSGVFMVGRVRMEALDPQRHVVVDGDGRRLNAQPAYAV